MSGVRHEEDGKVYTAPELCDVALLSEEYIRPGQVNAFIQKTLVMAGISAEDVKIQANSLEAKELTEILSSVTAGIYFKHTASIATARNSLRASLRIGQRIKAAACVEDRKPLLPTLMWKTLPNERQLIPSA
jgi:hypothetical protein